MALLAGIGYLSGANASGTAYGYEYCTTPSQYQYCSTSTTTTSTTTPTTTTTTTTTPTTTSTSTSTSTSTTTSTTTTTTTTSTSTKAGKGCGDKNHLHDRRFECKLSISGVSAKEGNSGTKAFTFTVKLSSTAIDPVTVDFATASGTATAGSDFVATSGTLTIPIGQSIGSVTVSVVGDTTKESNEVFYVNLLNPSPNAYLGNSQATGTILNDD